ncbi:MAG TPA: 2-hydroxymuconate tautomerase [Candidatus Angelobacter sp.]|jgi:4-oxalocrotonate tautomerase|nr:2-hydroxymuconate tautomerase [Candidatus Angelobacter sp.]
MANFTNCRLQSERSEDPMPLVQITLLKGRTVEQKRKVAERITQAMVEEAKAVKEAVIVTFIEVTREDYASGGVLMADRK